MYYCSVFILLFQKQDLLGTLKRQVRVDAYHRTIL